MDIHVTNLNHNLIEADIQRIFTPFGEINSVKILRDKWNNRSKGSAIIKMPVGKQATNAVASLMGFILAGQRISVVEVPGTEEQQFSNSMFLK